MSTAVANVTTKSPVEEFVDTVLDPDRMTELAKSLPAHIKPAMFQRNLLNAVMINPDLMSFKPGLLFREVSKAGALGLFLDPQLGEAYIVVAYNYKSKQKEPQLRVGYRGMIKLAKQTGEVNKIYAREVCQNDHFIAQMGTDENVDHKPKLFSNRGPIIGYYAVVKFKDGSFDFEPMSIDQVHEIRDRSDAWKAFVEKKISSTPWSTDEDEMAKKTAIRRLTKRLSQSPEIMAAINIEDNAEFSSLQPAALRIAPPPPPNEIQQSGAPSNALRVAATDAGGERIYQGSSSSPAPIEHDAPDWEKLIFDYQVRLSAEKDYGILEEIRNEFLAQDQMPVVIKDQALASYDDRIKELDQKEAEAERKRVAEAETKATKAAAAKAKKAAAEADAAPKQQADQAPPPPAEGEGSPSDKPAAAPPPPPADAAPTPAEVDMALAAQRDPAAIVRQLARQKAKNGTRRFNMWFGSLSDEDAKIVEDMPDMDEQIRVAEAADAAAKAAESNGG